LSQNILAKPDLSHGPAGDTAAASVCNLMPALDVRFRRRENFRAQAYHSSPDPAETALIHALASMFSTEVLKASCGSFSVFKTLPK